MASVCSGIGGGELAFADLADHAFASEVDPFARTVLAHRFPNLKVHGDFTEISATDGPVDVLVGGTPCQSFSIAGLRGGMADARGNLALEFLRLADRLSAKWILWENVPGVLSSNDGRDFGAFLGGLVELGYGFAYRILDAQFFGLAQRRKRVFVVGCLGDWRRAAAVLFEPASLRGNPAPSREARERTTGTLAASTGGSDENDAKDGRLIAFDWRASASQSMNPGPLSVGRADGTATLHYGSNEPDIARSLNAHAGGRYDGESETFVTTLASRGRSDGHNLEWREDGTANAILTPSGGRGGIGVGAVAILPLLEIGKGSSSRGVGPNGAGFGEAGDPMFTLQAGAQHGIAAQSAVRRLTPRECERLQGFPDDWTLVNYRGKPASDGPRYRALGNAFAVPVVRWIAKRLAREHSKLESAA